MRHSESNIQQAFLKWWSVAYRGLGVSDPRLLFAIPNGGARTYIQGSILKGEGVRAGVPDLFLAVPSVLGRHGMFLELKTWEGRTTSVQVAMMGLFRGMGYECVVAHGFDQAMSAVTQYLAGKEVTL